MVPSALVAIALVVAQAAAEAAGAVGQAAAEAATGAAPAVPPSGSGAGFGGGYGELLVVSLGLVAVVAVLAIAVVRGFGGRGWSRRGGGLLEVIARQPLEPRRSLYVVRAGTRTLLVGTSELGVTMLTELEGVATAGAEAVAPRAGAASGGFAELVRQAALRWRAGQAGGIGRGGAAGAGMAPRAGAADVATGVADAAAAAAAEVAGDAAVVADADASDTGAARGVARRA